MTVTEHQKRVEEIRDIAEKKAVVLIESYLKKIHFAFESGYRNNGINGANAVINQIRQTDLLELYKELYNKVGLYIAKKEYSFYENKLKKTNFNFFDEIWKQWILKAFQSIEITLRITKVTETTRQLYRELLLEASKSTMSPKEVMRLFISKRVTLISSRALMIARTEMTHAASLGTEYAADNFETNIGVELYKVWYHNKSRDYREAHAAINRTYKKRNINFVVNGKEMSYPGDPKGGASECINCRCSHSMATEAVLKEIGIWKG